MWATRVVIDTSTGPVTAASAAATTVLPRDTAIPSSPAARGSDYAVLLRRVKQAGLLERRPRYYLWKTAAIAAAFVGGWTVFALLGDTWWQLAVAVFLAPVFAQIAFVGHDAGHRQIFRGRRANYLYGLIAGNLGIGLSIGWWVSNHNRHHAHPNTEGVDPDAMGVLAYSSERARTETSFRRLIFRHQGRLFFPLVLLEAGSLHYKSVVAVLRWPIRHRGWEALLLGAHFAGYLAAVFLILSPVKALAFLAVQQGLFGFYMGCTFAPNHKGMEVFSVDAPVDFLRRQVLSSRNVRGGWLTDTAMGGLNYQIEHHLFPTMPRPALRRVRPVVIDYCAELGVPYRETGLLASYRESVGHLHTVGRFARRRPAAASAPLVAQPESVAG